MKSFFFALSMGIATCFAMFDMRIATSLTQMPIFVL